MDFNLSGPFELECWAKGNGTHNAPLFPTREISLPRLGKYRILDLLVVGNVGPLMLVYSNAHYRGVSIFGHTFNVAFLGFPTGLKPL